ncbi:DUF72 domain-containing protein [Belnapia sp. T18]|uniref:DUF72 domain-containing protein n=1 Tax=Belnapia arida TaxID=2804533 RepID=A0ABS1UDD2_9PROT|nr:DUF72 domain-containing protein [Belnapia arida]
MIMPQRHAETLAGEHRVARVAADPAPVPRAAEPGGWQALTYFRLHGSPRMYYSPYPQAYLDRLRHRLLSLDGAVWCTFDNTAEGAATNDALLMAAYPSHPRCQTGARMTRAGRMMDRARASACTASVWRLRRLAGRELGDQSVRLGLGRRLHRPRRAAGRCGTLGLQGCSAAGLGQRLRDFGQEA